MPLHERMVTIYGKGKGVFLPQKLQKAEFTKLDYQTVVEHQLQNQLQTNYKNLLI